MPIQTLKGDNRAASKPILAVVVVLDDPRAVARCPIQELHTPCGAHGYSEGVLVRWCDVHSTHPVAPVDEVGNLDSLVVDAQRNQARIGREKSLPCPWISGLLDSDTAPCIQQNMCTKLQGLLRSNCHENL